MARITLNPSGVQFDAKPGETVLSAALRNGHLIPHSCRNGRCGTCKGRVVAGGIQGPSADPRALSDAERARGFVLLCQIVPLGDATFEATPSAKVRVRKLPVRVDGLKRVADDVMILHLKLPAREHLDMLPGQYVDFLLKDGSRRSFSVANVCDERGLVELHVRHVPGGAFTDYVFTTMKERDILRMEGPLGSFYLREDSSKPVILVASGTGFAPMKAILESALRGPGERAIRLYWGARRPKDLYLHHLPMHWAADHSRFTYIPVVSNALEEDDWRGRAGFVHHAVMQDFPDLSACQVYACGVPVMVESARQDFISKCRLPADEFYADSFNTQADLRSEREASSPALPQEASRSPDESLG